MKVLLVYCNSMLENALPVGLSQISACLKEAGIQVDLFDTTFYRFGNKSDTENRIEALQFPPCPLNFREGNMYEEFKKKIEEFKPDLIGFSAVEPTFNVGMRLLESARKIIEENNIWVALGGTHAIMAPETATSYDLIEFICISEGEKAFVDLCFEIEGKKDIENSIGFWVRKGENWIKNPKAPLTDINNLPILDFSLFPESFLNKPMMGRLYRTISIETTRGCAYSCSYCGDHALRTLFKEQGHWYRQKKMEKIEQELKEYVATYKPEFVYIMSEAFLSGGLSRVQSFADMYKQFSIPFWFNTRPEDITEEKVKLIKEIGCKRISIGLEHGNEEYRKNWMHRKYSNEQIVNACRILKEYEISFSVNVIIGLPFENRDLVFDSIEVLRQIQPNGISTHIFNPYHGSEMRQLCVKEEMIDPGLIAEDFFQGDYCLKNNTISKEEVLGLFRTIPLYVEMDKSEYERIKVAEKNDALGNQAFSELKKEFYKLKGWVDVS